MKRLSFDFEVKAKGKDITIEGFANANTVDRMKERIDPKGWSLDNFKKNPVVLFDHGKDPSFGYMPVGKALAVEAMDEGLYTKIKLSNSQTEKITAVRDLVQEGILKTFSVGFDPKEDTKDGDTMLITKAELIECSIVPIPMNQDSTFSISGKSLSPMAKRWASGFERKRKLICEKKYLAAMIAQRIEDLEAKGGFDLNRAIDHVAKNSGMKPGDVRAVIDGIKTDVTPKAIKAFAEALDVSAKLLADAGFASFEKMKEGDAMDEKPADEKPADEKPTDEKPVEDETKAEPAMVVHQIHVPKAMFEESEGAAGMVEEHGYKADKMSETDTAWVFTQSEDCDTAKGAMVDLGQGVMAHVCPPKAEKACEPEEKPEDKKADDAKEFEDADLAKWSEGFAEDKAKTEDGKEGNPAPWVADEELWAKAKRASQAALGEVNFAFVTWWYLNQGGGKKSVKAKAAMPTGDAAMPPDDNPYLANMKTQISMMGVLIEEIKKMSAKLDGMVQTPKETEGETEDEAMKGILAQIRLAHKSTVDGLKRLGI